MIADHRVLQGDDGVATVLDDCLHGIDAILKGAGAFAQVGTGLLQAFDRQTKGAVDHVAHGDDGALEIGEFDFEMAELGHGGSYPNRPVM